MPKKKTTKRAVKTKAANKKPVAVTKSAPQPKPQEPRRVILRASHIRKTFFGKAFRRKVSER